jgi:hypothetical protein
MRKVWLSVLTAAATVLSSFSATQPVTVAVFDFEAREDALKEAGAKLGALLQATLSANENFITVERAELEKILGEQELGASGNVAPDTAARIGHLTGAKVLVTGRVFKLDKDITAVAKIMSSETSRVFAETVKGSSLTEVSNGLGEKVSKTLKDKQRDLAPSIANRDESLKKLIAANKKQRTTAIAVTIPEQHFGARVADPAAETELKRIFQETGFTVVDSKSDQRPDIEISGEAFSALGLRKGNLISCKSRIELTARQRSDGKILHTDRQTSVAVDITEQTAAKTALENAARALAARLLAKL